MTAGAATWQVLPQMVEVEAGGAASVFLVKGKGAHQVRSFQATWNGSPTNYMLARRGGVSEGQVTVMLHAREDAPKTGVYGVRADGNDLSIQVRLVAIGEATQRGNEGAPRDLRQLVRESDQRQIVVTPDEVPKISRMSPDPLRIPPDGATHEFVFEGSLLNLIDDVRIRKAESPARYRGKTGQLPFKLSEGRLKVSIQASRHSAMGESYLLDLMVGKYLAVTLPLEVGEIPHSEEQKDTSPPSGPLIIVLPESASSGSSELGSEGP